MDTPNKDSSEANSAHFLNKALLFFSSALEHEADKDSIIHAYSVLAKEYKERKGPILAYCVTLLEDIQCLLGIYESSTSDYKDLRPEYSFAQKIEVLKEHTLKLLSGKAGYEASGLFEYYTRWIRFEGKTIEVECVLNQGWEGIIYKGLHDSIYYLSELEWRNGGYLERIRIITEDQYKSFLSPR